MNKERTPPHGRLSSQEASDKLAHWAGILLGKSILNLDFSWVEVQRRMAEARWLGHEPLVDDLLMVEVRREQDWRAHQAAMLEKIKADEVFVAKDLARCETLDQVCVIDEHDRVWYGVVPNRTFWLDHGRECYEYAVKRINEVPPYWRAVATRIWGKLPRSVQLEILQGES